MVCVVFAACVWCSSDGVGSVAVGVGRRTEGREFQTPQYDDGMDGRRKQHVFQDRGWNSKVSLSLSLPTC